MIRPLRILMLEDNTADAELIVRELRKAGIDSTQRRVDSREAFVASLDDLKPDVILADYRLPSFDGLSALAIALEAAPDVPLIFVSGAMGEEFAIETLHQGAADYVLKDRLIKLGPAVRRALEEAEARKWRRQAEIALAENEEKFRQMAEAAQDAIAIIDPDGKIVFWNQAATRIFGYSADEVAGRGMHESLAPAHYLEAYRAGWKGFRETGQGHVVGKTIEVTALRRDGSEFPAEVSISAALLQRRWHAIGIVRDVSERKLVEEALRRSNRFLRMLSRCNEALVQADDEERLLRTMCRIVVEVGGFALAWVGYDEGDGPASSMVRPKAWFGRDASKFFDGFDVLRTEEARNGESVNGPSVPGRIRIVEEITEEATTLPWRGRAIACGYRSAVSLPLIASNQLVGSLNIFSAEPGSFNEGEVGILRELADDLAFGIATLRARGREQESARKLEKSLEDTIRAVATTIEARDPYTAGHQLRVSQLARAIATEMGLPADRIVGVQRGAEIHDIGKIQIPAEILNRPGRIGELEMRLIRTHPQVGYDIVRDIDFPWPIADMILQHHERLDGSGYPNGLKGDEILLEARIIAVADVVEAMMSHRPYRAAVGIEAALETIRRGKGTLFDPEVVAICVGLLQSGQFATTSPTGSFV